MTKNICLTLVAGLAIAAGSAHASPIFLFDTGVNFSGVPVPNGTTEIHYTLISVPGGTTTVRAATSANGFPIPPWLGNDATSTWIGPASNGTMNGPAGTYIYRTTFTLAGLIPSTASIIGQWAADDQGTNILINGVSTGSTTAGFSAFNAFSINSGFVAGLNTLDFVVSNSIPGPTGLRVEMTGTASPISVGAPEPASLILVGAGMIAVGFRRRRRA